MIETTVLTGYVKGGSVFFFLEYNQYHLTACLSLNIYSFSLNCVVL